MKYLLVLILLLSCSNPTEAKPPVLPKAEDLYAALKPNGIEIQNDFSKDIYYYLAKSKLTDLNAHKIGTEISTKLTPKQYMIISHDGYTSGDERYIYWWTDSYKSEADLFIKQLH